MIRVLKFKKMHKDAVMPSRGSTGAAGLDLSTISDITIKPGHRALVSTGIAMSIPDGYVGLIWARSKLAAKKGIVVLAGVIDADYNGIISVALLNTSDTPIKLLKNDRVAQLIIQKHYSDLRIIEEVGELQESDRGDSGINCSEMRY